MIISAAKHRNDMPLAPRWLGVVVLAVWLGYAAEKASQGILPEMLWACHVATLAVIIGLFGRWRNWVAAGFLFHAAAGLLGYSMDALANWPPSLLSLLSHIVPLGVGLLAVWGQIWPRWVRWVDIAACAAVLPLTYWLTEPALNINLVHAPWPPLASWFPNLASVWVYNMVIAAVLIVSVDAVFRRSWSSQS